MGQVQHPEGALISVRLGKMLLIIKDKAPVFIKIYRFPHNDVLSGLLACHIRRHHSSDKSELFPGGAIF